MSFHLFVYGSLRDPAVFEAVTGVPCPEKTAAVLAGYDFGRPFHSYPTLRPSPGRMVEGELILDVPDEALAKLDAYECVEEPESYCRKTVTVEGNGSTIEAFVYVSKSSDFSETGGRHS